MNTFIPEITDHSKSAAVHSQGVADISPFILSAIQTAHTRSATFNNPSLTQQALLIPSTL